MIPAGFQSEDAQDDSQGKERVGAGDCAKNAGLGVAFWETISIEPETGSTQQGEQEANDSSQKPRSILPAGAGIDGAVQVLGDRLGRNNGAKAAASPGGYSGTWNLDMPGNGLGAAPNNVVAEAVVVGTPRVRCRGDGRCHSAKIASASQNLNDLKDAALANTK